uniref:Ceramide synthase 5 n=1 Tax=Phasianus colchicus TaxID=9054 RepID=A0A669QHV9_PHACC
MAAAAVAAMRAWFWNERFWLPHNVTWADLAGEPDGGLQYPRASHVLSAFPLALGIFAVRLLFESWMLSAHGQVWCSISYSVQHPYLCVTFPLGQQFLLFAMDISCSHSWSRLCG